MPDLATTYGSLLLGASAAYVFSGIVGLQCIIYFRLYPNDLSSTKVLVSSVWILDLTHTAFICASLIYYFVKNFGISQVSDSIPWSVALTVVVTAIQTFIVHCYFARKILKSSKNNWFITGPIILLALCRLLAACVSTVEMVRLHRFSAFTQKYPGWVFTLGLSLSSATDIVITGWLCYFLRELRGRIGSSIMIKVVDTLTIYTIETGALTCIATTASLICWLSMPHNLVFLGLHFVIGKLYANSLLASLNTRKELRRMRTRHRQWVHSSVPVLSTTVMTSTMQTQLTGVPEEAYKPPSTARQLQISVERTIEHEVVEERRRSRRQSRYPLAWDVPVRPL